ncbi:hypothetical protein JKP88DRAFT_316635 [Tribonema minus]|uniref:RNA polymerase sigma-70 domain-containing protein n=1 Tax=Tribonema minus TaxID=303371 RepID=A0A835YXH6_9STRA|nr:hypothetical protein JKP88DRAFT_316635 [Tribonema minus]
MAASVQMRPARPSPSSPNGGPGRRSSGSAVLEELYQKRGPTGVTSTSTSHEATVSYLSEHGAAEAKLAAKVYMFDELGTADLLSHKQEMELGYKIQQLVAMELIRDQLEVALRRQPTDSEWAEACGYTREHRELFRAAYTDCLHAKHAMVSSNMRLVIAVAKRYGRMGVPLSDLVQEGSLGLIRAAEKYDPAKGFKFSTYAAWWIQQAIFKAIAYHSRTIRLPVHVHNLLYSVRRARKNLTLELGRAPTEGELASRVGVPLERLRKYLRASRSTISTEIPSASSGFNPQDQVLGDTLVARDMVAPEDSAEMGLFRKRLEEVMLALPEEERRVVTLRFGLEDGKSRSLAEIASASRCSKDWVRRTESRAMRKLRAPQHQQR